MTLYMFNTPDNRIIIPSSNIIKISIETIPVLVYTMHVPTSFNEGMEVDGLEDFYVTKGLRFSFMVSVELKETEDFTYKTVLPTEEITIESCVFSESAPYLALKDEKRKKFDLRVKNAKAHISRVNAIEALKTNVFVQPEHASVSEEDEDLTNQINTVSIVDNEISEDDIQKQEIRLEAIRSSVEDTPESDRVISISTVKEMVGSEYFQEIEERLSAYVKEVMTSV